MLPGVISRYRPLRVDKKLCVIDTTSYGIGKIIEGASPATAQGDPWQSALKAGLLKEPLKRLSRG